MGVLVGVTDGISVLVIMTGMISVTAGGMEVRMIGVAVTMFGVREGGTIQVAIGWGEPPKVSHAPRRKIKTKRTDIFFMG
jgi:hypothetical protein